MDKLIRIGIDTSKSVFQLHGVNASEDAVLKRQLRRSQLGPWFAKLEPTKIGIEACGGSHHLARQLAALGHEVVLVPPQYAKVYVARGKNDAADAEAICEAMSRPKVQKRFVAVKTAEQQAAQMLVHTRDAFIRRRTQLSNAIRGYAAEFGLVVPKGLAHLEPLLARIEEEEASVPALARELFRLHNAEYVHVQIQLRRIDAMLMVFHRQSEMSQRLTRIPTLGPIGASLLAAKVTDPKSFKSGRDFAAWIGLTPKDHSTAGRHRSGGITRAGDERLRSTLVVGAMAVIQQVMRGNTRLASPWLIELLKRKPPKLVAVALAGKTARIAWKLMVSGESYHAGKAARKNVADPNNLQEAA
jgi:transposase